jgi:hypothetical protein
MRFDADYIPSAPFNPHALTESNPQHLTLEDDSVARRRRPEHVFNPDTGILRIDLFFNSPERDDVKQLINQTIREARPRGLCRVVILIAAETAAAIEAYTFFSRNHFQRNTSGEPAGFLKYERVAHPVELKPMDDIDRRAARIKERSTQAREKAKAKEMEPTSVPDFLRLKYESELKKLEG